MFYWNPTSRFRRIRRVFSGEQEMNTRLFLTVMSMSLLLVSASILITQQQVTAKHHHNPLSRVGKALHNMFSDSGGSSNSNGQSNFTTVNPLANVGTALQNMKSNFTTPKSNFTTISTPTTPTPAASTTTTTTANPILHEIFMNCVIRFESAVYPHLSQAAP